MWHAFSEEVPKLLESWWSWTATLVVVIIYAYAKSAVFRQLFEPCVKPLCKPYRCCRDGCGASPKWLRGIFLVIFIVLWLYFTLLGFDLPDSFGSIGITEWIWLVGSVLAMAFVCCGRFRSMMGAVTLGIMGCHMSFFLGIFALAFSCVWDAIACLGITSLLAGSSTAGVKGKEIVEAGTSTDAPGTEAKIAANAALFGEAAVEGTAVAHLAAVSEAAQAAESAGEVAETVAMCTVS